MPDPGPYPRKSWSIQVHRGSILEPPVLDADDVDKVVVRNRDGVPAIALVRVHGGAWGVSMATDDDWAKVCALHGIS